MKIFLRYFGIILGAMAVAVGFGFYLAKYDDAEPVILKDILDEIFIFVEGAAEEKTNLNEKIRAQLTGKERIERSRLDVERLRKLPVVGSKNEIVVRSNVPLNLLEGLIIRSSDKKSGKMFLVKFSGGILYLGELENDLNVVDFDVKADMIALLGTHGLRIVDQCAGNFIWEKKGRFHHYFSANHERIAVLGSIIPEEIADAEEKRRRRIWTDYNHNISIFNLKDGQLISEFDFYDIALKNIQKFDPLIIESLKRYRKELPNGTFVNTRDVWHPNDIEMVSEDFKDLDVLKGDLLISAKGLNLIFQISPETLEIKRYWQGYMMGQHDPDFNSDGTVTVFNNKSEDHGVELYSSVDQINLRDNSIETLVSAEEARGVTRHSGGHSVLLDVVVMDMSLEGRHLVFDKRTKKWVGTIAVEIGDTFKNSVASVFDPVSKLESSGVCDFWRPF